MSMRRRVVAGFTALMTLFLAVILVQLVVGDRLRAHALAHADDVRTAREANQAVLQHMTDAETGLRGFQLTGERSFLESYDSGRQGAFTLFDVIESKTGDPRVPPLVFAERQAAGHWLTAYAVPVVNAGVADRSEVQAERGKRMFDDIRTTNAAVATALDAEQAAVARADRRLARLWQLFFGAVAAGLLAMALLLAVLHQRQLLAPVEHIRLTLLRLAAGDRSARAVPAGPAEMRAVIGTLNDLAARTEQLLDAEQARSVRNELRQAVATELRASADLGRSIRRVAELIGTALGADAVHGRVAVDDGRTVRVRWPAGAPSLSPRTVRDVLSGSPGSVQTVPNLAGAIAVLLAGDADGPPGLLYLVRHTDREWTGDERRLVAALAREIEHATGQQRMRQRQARLISELRSLDQRKDAFVATVTHELRTPLTSILGYLEMLADGDGGELTARQRRSVEAILRNACRLRDTIGDLLVLHPAGRRSDAAPEPVDLATVTAAALAEVGPVARARELRIDGAADPAPVLGDPVQLERAVRNLLHNAVKFTAPGGRIDWRVTADGGSAVVTVTDTGIGIPADDLPGLFTPFHRAANAMDQAVQGSGLGLAIVRSIVTEHGGDVSVRSWPGRGSTFTLTLPLAAPVGLAAPARSGRG